MKNIFLIGILFSFVGCQSGKNAMKISDSLQLISKGSLHGVGKEGIKAQKTIIVSEGEWHALLEKMNSVNNVSENFKNKEIDFSKEIVIAIFDEVKGTGGHTISVSQVQETVEEVIVNVRKTAPEGMATTVITQPYYLAKMKKTSKPIVFE